MTGVSGGETGIRGLSLRTIRTLARSDGHTEAFRVWATGNCDPDTQTAYSGTDNGGPWMGDKRPGDNLYTASTFAIDVNRRDQGAFSIHAEGIVGLG